jgi:hypothetical protein
MLKPSYYQFKLNRIVTQLSHSRNHGEEILLMKHRYIEVVHQSQQLIG